MPRQNPAFAVRTSIARGPSLESEARCKRRDDARLQGPHQPAREQTENGSEHNAANCHADCLERRAKDHRVLRRRTEHERRQIVAGSVETCIETAEWRA